MADDDNKTPLQRAFEEMDEDNSGTLDREEVRSLCEMAGNVCSDAELDAAPRRRRELVVELIVPPRS